MTPGPSPAEGADELDRDSPVPLYHQVEQALLRLITTATLAAGSRFPSETELCARFGVTRPTVRQALDRLVRVGVLRRERGRGTFVANVPLPEAAPAPARTRRPVKSEKESEKVVKVVMPSLTELIHLRVLAGIVDQAHDDGLQVVLTHSDGRPAAQERELANVAGTADGVLLWPVGDTPRRSAALLDLSSRGVPVVFVDRYLDSGFDHVVVDDEAGAYALTTHLLGLGHRRIAFVHAESTALSSVRLRHRGYRTAMTEHENSTGDDLVLDLSRSDSLDALVDHLLAAPATAAFCVNDVVAVGLIGALERRGIRVPDEVSVAGFDALERLPEGRVLTSVRRATGDMGRAAVRLLAARLRSCEPRAGTPPDTPTDAYAESGAGPRHLTLPSALVIGDTTAPPATGQRR